MNQTEAINIETSFWFGPRKNPEFRSHERHHLFDHSFQLASKPTACVGKEGGQHLGKQPQCSGDTKGQGHKAVEHALPLETEIGGALFMDLHVVVALVGAG